MFKHLWASAVSIVAIVSFNACDEDTTSASNSGPISVSTVKDLSECTTDNSGDMAYVKDIASMYFCADSVWKEMAASTTSASDGKNAADSKDVSSCTVKEIQNGYKVLCGGDSVGVLSNGAKGDKGDQGDKGEEGKKGDDGNPGANGSSCTTKALDNGNGYKILCGKDSVGVVRNGAKGGNGEPGISITGPKGEDGESCTIAEDKGGVVTLQCGEGENAKTTKLYKALCGSDPYDPETQRCVDGSVFGKCGKGTYIENVEFCYDGEAYPLCGKDLLEYNPNREACKDGVVLSLCGTKTFDPAVYACVSGMILPLCVNEPYNPDLQECDDETGSVTDKYVEYCGTKPYDPNIKFCDKRDGENVIYGMVTVTHWGMGYSETWMTDNLRYKTKTGSVCHPDDNDACTEYGRFYVWDAATWVDDDTGNYVDICPDGWQLPTYDQYSDLAKAFGGPERAGIPLKSKDWDGTNESGLNILEAGYVEIKNNAYVFNNDSTSFWTRNPYNSSIAFSFDVHDGKKNLAISKQDKKLPKSVRCIKKKTNK